MDRVFLDANVLFSAAYKPTRLRLLWKLPNVELVSSKYAVREAEVNLGQVKPEALQELRALLQGTEQVQPATLLPLPPSISLVKKDAPILQAAIATKATHLLTGDVKHFGSLFGRIIEGVLVLLPAEYLNQQETTNK